MIGFRPHELAVTKDGTTAYIANFGLNDYDHLNGTAGFSISMIELHTWCEDQSWKLRTQQCRSNDHNHSTQNWQCRQSCRPWSQRAHEDESQSSAQAQIEIIR